MATTTAAHTLNLTGVLSESKRIVNAHSCHFLALSVVFLLPLSFSFIIFPTLTNLSDYDVVSTQFLVINNNHHHPDTLLTIPILYTLFLYTFFIASVATITYSTFHGFYGRPVKFFPAIKSLIYSFFPLFSTIFAAQILLFLISLAVVLFFIVLLKFGDNLGFLTHYGSNYFIVFSVLLGGVLGLLVMFFQVHWSLACVVVVAESKWGFQPLWRSSYLVKGMTTVSLSLLLLFGILIGFWVWLMTSLHFDFDFDASVDGWKSWPFVCQLVIGTTFLTLFFLHNTAANTVLYMYCKALHGELAIEIADEFAREYVSLPFDDQKLPHVVTVIPA